MSPEQYSRVLEAARKYEVRPHGWGLCWTGSTWEPSRADSIVCPIGALILEEQPMNVIPTGCAQIQFIAVAAALLEANSQSIMSFVRGFDSPLGTPSDGEWFLSGQRMREELGCTS